MRIVLIVLAIALVLYSLLDCARTPEEGLPARIPKFVWIILIILFPTVGAIAWIITSRVKAAEERGGVVEPTVWSSREGTTFQRPARPRPVAPDEDPEFLRSLESGVEISFDNFKQFNDMIMDIAEAIESEGLEYVLEYGENDKGYKTYRIEDVFSAS